MARSVDDEIRELRDLAHDPPRQTEYAATLIRLGKAGGRSGGKVTARGNAVILAALDILIASPAPAALEDLFALYDFYTDNENRDPACLFRSRIVQALQPLVGPRDLGFFWRVVQTYVFPPPQFTEEGQQLRANGLLAMADLDLEAARFAGARLLFDAHTAPMSGEPAVTAAQVLSRVEELVPLYAYSMQAQGRIVPEVGAQVLRGLTNLDAPMLEQVIARFAHSEDARREGEVPWSAPVVAGFFELLLSQSPMPAGGRTYLWAFLRENSPLDLYRYLVTLLVTTGSEDGWSLIEALVTAEEVPVRRRIVREALEVALDARRAAPLIAALDARLTK